MEAQAVVLAGVEDPAHFLGGHAVGEACREEGARTHADIDFEPCQVEAFDRVVECAQRAQFVHAADRAAAGDRKAYAGTRLAGFACGLYLQHQGLR